ncbi:MAG: hypothetical protein OK474_02170 [Thaumarchaeota archaeon]|nr:hypothetical protein [Nitrososphaerota archaeon]
MRRRASSWPKMVVAIVVAAAIALAALGYAVYVRAPVGSGAGSSDAVTVSASVTAPNAYGVSQLDVEVDNTARDPLWTIEVTNSSGLPGSTFIAFYHNTAIVSAANALSVGQTATGSASVRDVTAGATYVLNMTFIFSTGSTQVQTFSVTAEG